MPVLLEEAVTLEVPPALVEVVPTAEVSVPVPVPGAETVEIDAAVSTPAPDVVEIEVVVSGGGRHVAEAVGGRQDAAGLSDLFDHMPRHLAD